jgi:hypothetical protein
MEPVPPTAEHQPIIDGLSRRGVDGVVVAWDDPGFDWTAVDAAVLRSTWDYHLRRDSFLAWTRKVPRLLNPARVVEWNSHKGYLKELEARAAHTVPTLWVPRGPPPLLVQLLSAHGWSEAVVKPCVSASAHQTVRFSLSDWKHAQDMLAVICATGDAMVQPYLKAVETHHERSLIFIDGVFSHAVRREPVLITHRFAATRVTAEDDELWIAENALRGLETGPLLYARVDLIRDDRNDVRVMELELIEPALYLYLCPEAAQSLADAIVRRVSAWRAGR